MSDSLRGRLLVATPDLQDPNFFRTVVLVLEHTDDGALKLTSSGAGYIDARSASGDITAVDLRAVNGALISNDGHVSISFTPTADATVNVHAGDGDVHVAGLPSTENEDHRSVVHVGAGRGHLEVSSGAGSITISQGASV